MWPGWSLWTDRVSIALGISIRFHNFLKHFFLFNQKKFLFVFNIWKKYSYQKNYLLWCPSVEFWHCCNGKQGWWTPPWSMHRLLWGCGCHIDGCNCISNHGCCWLNECFMFYVSWNTSNEWFWCFDEFSTGNNSLCNDWELRDDWHARRLRNCQSSTTLRNHQYCNGIAETPWSGTKMIWCSYPRQMSKFKLIILSYSQLKLLIVIPCQN